jgi:hypothetical protein
LESSVGRIAAHYTIVFATFFSIIFFLQLFILEILGSSVADDSYQGAIEEVTVGKAGPGGSPPLRTAQPDFASETHQGGSNRGSQCHMHESASVPLTGLSKYAGSAILTWLLLFVLPYPAEKGWFFERFVVYEQQILLGLAFAMPGLYCVVMGVKRKSAAYMAVAVSLFSLGAWTRVTWFPFAWILLFISFFLVVKWSDEPRTGDRLRRAMMSMAPAALLLIGMMVVNFVRFDSPFDFGVRYQDPGDYIYFRNLKMFFSPATRVWNAIFNGFSYFAPPQWAISMGLFERSFARNEGLAPSFFFLNPQFIPMLILVPLGMYKAHKRHSPLFVSMLALLATIVYLNIVIGFFGTIVIMRYFVEFYYFLILLFVAALFVFLSPRLSILIVLLSLIMYIPQPAGGFLFSRPELRTVNGWPDAKALNSPPGRTPFLVPQAKWAEGKLSAENLGQIPPYAVMGVKDGRGGNLTGMDIFCVYLIPKDMPSAPSRATLTVSGLEPLSLDGTAFFFFENRSVASKEISRGTTIDVDIKLPFSIPRKAPYQVMVLFLPAGRSYLEPRETGKPTVQFREILLQAQTPPEATSARP